MYNYRTLILALISVSLVVGAGFIVSSSPMTEADSDTGSSTYQVLNVLMDYIGDETEAGFDLKLDDEKTIDLYKSVWSALPDSVQKTLRDINPVGFKSYDEFEKVYGESNGSASGEVGVLAKALKNDDGSYTLTLLADARVSAEIDSQQHDIRFQVSATAVLDSDFVLKDVAMDLHALMDEKPAKISVGMMFSDLSKEEMLGLLFGTKGEMDFTVQTVQDAENEQSSDRSFRISCKSERIQMSGFNGILTSMGVSDAIKVSDQKFQRPSYEDVLPAMIANGLWMSEEDYAATMDAIRLIYQEFSGNKNGFMFFFEKKVGGEVTSSYYTANREAVRAAVSDVPAFAGIDYLDKSGEWYIEAHTVAGEYFEVESKGFDGDIPAILNGRDISKTVDEKPFSAKNTVKKDGIAWDMDSVREEPRRSYIGGYYDGVSKDVVVDRTVELDGKTYFVSWVRLDRTPTDYLKELTLDSLIVSYPYDLFWIPMEKVSIGKLVLDGGNLEAESVDEVAVSEVILNIDSDSFGLDILKCIDSVGSITVNSIGETISLDERKAAVLTSGSYGGFVWSVEDVFYYNGSWFAIFHYDGVSKDVRLVTPVEIDGVSLEVFQIDFRSYVDDPAEVELDSLTIDFSAEVAKSERYSMESFPIVAEELSIKKAFFVDLFPSIEATASVSIESMELQLHASEDDVSLDYGSLIRIPGMKNLKISYDDPASTAAFDEQFITEFVKTIHVGGIIYEANMYSDGSMPVIGVYDGYSKEVSVLNSVTIAGKEYPVEWIRFSNDQNVRVELDSLTAADIPLEKASELLNQNVGAKVVELSGTGWRFNAVDGNAELYTDEIWDIDSWMEFFKLFCSQHIGFGLESFKMYERTGSTYTLIQELTEKDFDAISNGYDDGIISIEFRLVYDFYSDEDGVNHPELTIVGDLDYDPSKKLIVPSIGDLFSDDAFVILQVNATNDNYLEAIEVNAAFVALNISYCQNLSRIIFSSEAKANINANVRSCDNLSAVCFVGPISSVKGTFDRCSEIEYLQFKSEIDEFEVVFHPLAKITDLVFEGPIGILSNSFNDFTSLKSVKFCDNVGTLSHSFNNCDKLENVTFQKDVQEFGEHIFEGCGQSIFNVQGNIGKIGVTAFHDVTAVFNFGKDSRIGTIESGAFSSSLANFNEICSRSTNIEPFALGVVRGTVDAIEAGAEPEVENREGVTVNGKVVENTDYANRYITVSGTWTIASGTIVYLEFSALVVPAGAKVIIEAGAALKASHDSTIYVAGALELSPGNDDVMEATLYSQNGLLTGPNATIGASPFQIISEFQDRAHILDYENGDYFANAVTYIENRNVSAALKSVTFKKDMGRFEFPTSMKDDDGKQIQLKGRLPVSCDSMGPVTIGTMIIPSWIDIHTLRLGNITVGSFSLPSGYSDQIVSGIHYIFDTDGNVVLMVKANTWAGDLKFPAGVVYLDVGINDLDIRTIDTVDLLYLPYFGSKKIDALTIGPGLRDLASDISYDQVTINDNPRFILKDGILYAAADDDYADYYVVRVLESVTGPELHIKSQETVGEGDSARTFNIFYLDDDSFKGIYELQNIVIDNGIGVDPYAFSQAVFRSNGEPVLVSLVLDGDRLDGDILYHSRAGMIISSSKESNNTVVTDRVGGGFIAYLIDQNGDVRIVNNSGLFSDDVVIERPIEIFWESLDVSDNIRIILPETVKHVNVGTRYWGADKESYMNSQSFIYLPSDIDEYLNSLGGNWQVIHYDVSDYHHIQVAKANNGQIVATITPCNGVESYYIKLDGSATSAEPLTGSATVTIADDIGYVSVESTLKVYDVTFSYGNILDYSDDTVKVTYGERMDIPRVPIYAGADFVGWYVDDKYTEEFDFESPIVEDTKLYALWTSTVTLSTEGVRVNLDSAKYHYVLTHDSPVRVAPGTYDVNVRPVAGFIRDGTTYVNLDGSITLGAITFEGSLENHTISVENISKRVSLSVSTPGLIVEIENKNKIMYLDNGSMTYLAPGKYEIYTYLEGGYEGEDTLMLNDVLVDTYYIVLTEEVNVLTDPSIREESNPAPGPVPEEPTDYITVAFEVDTDKAMVVGPTAARVEAGSWVEFPKLIAKDGYRMIGWLDGIRLLDGGNVEHSDVTITAMLVDDAEAEMPTFTVIWENPNGQELKRLENVAAGSVVEYGSIPSMTDDSDSKYMFVGWEGYYGPIMSDAVFIAAYTNYTPVKTEVETDEGIITLEIFEIENGFCTKQVTSDIQGQVLMERIDEETVTMTEDGFIVFTHNASVTPSSKGNSWKEVYIYKDNNVLVGYFRDDSRLAEAIGKVAIDADSVKGTDLYLDYMVSDAMLAQSIIKQLDPATQFMEFDFSNSITLSKAAIKNMADAGLTIYLFNDFCNLALPEKIYNKIGDDMTLTFSMSDKSELNEAQINAIGDGKEFLSISLESNGAAVHELGSEIGVELQFYSKDIVEPTVYYVDELGNLNNMRTVYELNDKHPERSVLTFYTDHFSVFMIGDADLSRKPLTDLEVAIDDWVYGSAPSVPAMINNAGNGTTTYLYKSAGASDSTYTSDVPVDAGRYVIRAIVEATDEYQSGTAMAEFSIEQRPVTVRAIDVTKFVNRNEPAFRASVTGLVGQDTISYTVSCNYSDIPGSYRIIPAGERSQGNYIVTYYTGTLEVSYAPDPGSSGGSGSGGSGTTPAQKPIVIEKEDGSKVERVTNKIEGGTSITETTFDANGNKTGSTQSDLIESKEADGSSVTIKIATNYDSDGKQTEAVSVKETVKESDDGSSVRTVTETKYDSEGKPTTSTSESVTVSADGSTTRSMTEESYDDKGQFAGSTTVELSQSKSAGGDLIEQKVVVVKDANGAEKMTSDISIKSGDESVQTKASTATDSNGETKATVETTVSLTADPQSGSLTVNNEDIGKALAQMNLVETKEGVETSKCIEVSSGGSNGANVTLSSQSLGEIRKAGADVRISSNQGSITISPQVSENLDALGSEITMSVKKADVKSLTVRQASIVGDSPVFSLNADVDGSPANDKLGGEVTITLPYYPKEGEDLEHITVYYVDDKGGLFSRTTSYDPVSHTVSFKTDHFSFYMISTAGLDTVADDSDNTLIYVGVAALIIAAVIIAAVAVTRRTK